MNARHTWLALLTALTLVAACAPSDPFPERLKKVESSSSKPDQSSLGKPRLKPTDSEGIPAPPAELPSAGGDIRPATVPFQSPSRNLRCTMFTGTDGLAEARCTAIEHDWHARRPAECDLNWGDRLDLRQGEEATFGCYNSDMPPPLETLPYKQGRSLGTLICFSEESGMTCADNETGHYFRVSRQRYELG